MRIGIYLYPDVEVLDVAGPFEVFTTANRLASRQHLPAPFEVQLLANQAGTIAARAGFPMTAAVGFADCPALDLLLLPGGYHLDAMHDQALLAFIRQHVATHGQVACVCTGVFLLAQALPQLAAAVTTHWEDQADLAQAFPALHVLRDVRYVQATVPAGALQSNLQPASSQPPSAEQTKPLQLWSSGGISAGIDLSLELVARFASEALAQATAKQMEFRWCRQPQP